MVYKSILTCIIVAFICHTVIRNLYDEIEGIVPCKTTRECLNKVRNGVYCLYSKHTLTDVGIEIVSVNRVQSVLLRLEKRL